MRSLTRIADRGPASCYRVGTAYPAVEIVFEDLDERRFDRDPAVLAALAANVDHGTVVAAPKVADVGTQEFICAQTGKQRGEGRAPSRQYFMDNDYYP